MGYVDVSFNDNPLVAQVYVYDINEPNHLYSGRFIGPLSVIYFNTAHMDNWTYEQRKKTAVRELGHALGLNEFKMTGNSNLLQDESNSNVMFQGLNSFTDFGPCDRLVYYHKWRDDV